MAGRKIVLIMGGWGLCLLASGCQCYLGRYAVEREFHPSQCEERWDPVLGCCQQCGQCGGDCPGFTPCMYAKHMKTCVAGGGEIYWNEWISDPPDDCDPCDNCANWVGTRCCPPKLHEQLAIGVLGQRCGLCNEMGCEHMAFDDGQSGEEFSQEFIEENFGEPEPQRVPTPANRRSVPVPQVPPADAMEVPPTPPIGPPNTTSVRLRTPRGGSETPRTRTGTSAFRAISVREPKTGSR